MVEDAQLFREAQGGSSHAFGQLVRRHEAHVGAVVIARMRQTAQVDDVVQETFIAAWMRRDSLSDPEKFRAWICGIARNQAAKVRRRESRPVPILDTGMTDSVEDELLRAESERVLADSLSALPEEHREVIILYYREERSIREIATALRLSEAAAQKRISRARSSVKESVLARLGEALPATKSTAGASAAVLASITIGVAPATANASLGIGNTGIIAKGTNLMNTIAITTLVAFAGGTAVYSYASSDEVPEVRAAGNSTKVAATVNPPATVLPRSEATAGAIPTAVQLRRVSRSERAARFALHRSTAPQATSTKPQATSTKPATNSPVTPRAHGLEDKDIIRSTIGAVRPLIVECHELAALSEPFLVGKVIVRFDISDEPEIAGLVTQASVKSREGGFTPPNADFEECLEETLMSLEFVGMSKGIAVTYPFVFRAPPNAVPSNLSTAQLLDLIEESDDASQLMEIANQLSANQPNEETTEQSMRACERAIELGGPTLTTSFRCTLNACATGQKDEAQAFWATSSQFSFGDSLTAAATKACAEQGIELR